MNRVNIYRTVPKEQTVVSNLFIDEYMADANDAQLKIYLFLVRMMNANLPTCVADIADKFNYTEKDVLRALSYWESRELLALAFDAAHNLSGIEILSLETPYEAPMRSAPRITPVLSFMHQPNAPTRTSYTGTAGTSSTYMRTSTTMTGLSAAARTGRMADRKIMANSSAPVERIANTQNWEEPPRQESVQPPDNALIKPEYSLDDLKNFKSNEEVEQLLMVTEQYVGTHLSRSDVETVLFIYDRLGFSADLIDYLVQHCVELGKKDFRYMEKVALAWHDRGITTPKEAQLSTRKYDKSVYTIMKLLGKNTTPAPKELEYINKWTNEYGFLLDVIREACDKTVLTTDSHRFEYADGILSKWYQAGAHHKSDIPLVDAPYKRSVQTQNKAPKADNNSTAKNKFNHFAQNTYDFEQLEENILSN